MNQEDKPPHPPFDLQSAILKVRKAEDAWNSQNPDFVALAYTPDCCWRNRSEFIRGRSEIVQFLQRKWEREKQYRLIKELWAFGESRISVRFQYEYSIANGGWFRAYGNENWEFASNGLMSRREASINDVPIRVEERKFLWALGPRPREHLGLEAMVR